MAQIDANEVQLVAILTARSGKESALREALLSIIPAVRGEAGCLNYAMHVDREHPERIIMFERWSDQQALDNHGSAAPFQSLAVVFGTLLAKPIELIPLQQIG